MDKIVIWYFTR